jgi:hypothetical protein
MSAENLRKEKQRHKVIANTRANKKSKFSLLDNYLKSKISTKAFYEENNRMYSNPITKDDIKSIIKSKWVIEYMVNSHKINENMLREKLKELLTYVKEAMPFVEVKYAKTFDINVKFKDDAYVRKFYKKHKGKDNLLELIDEEIMWLERDLKRDGVPERILGLKELSKTLKRILK